MTMKKSKEIRKRQPLLTCLGREKKVAIDRDLVKLAIRTKI